MKQRFSKRTRLVSALLTLAMVFTFLPFSAFAANTEIDFNSPDFKLNFPDAAEAEELGANHRPSTLERLASLANAKEKCDAPECSPVGCRKVRDAREL